MALRPAVLQVVAYEAIPPFTPYTYAGRIADSTDTDDFWQVVGISERFTTPRNQVIETLEEGEIFGTPFNWVPGAKIYLNGRGVLSMTEPTTGFVQIVGVAIDNKSIRVQISYPILL